MKTLIPKIAPIFWYLLIKKNDCIIHDSILLT